MENPLIGLIILFIISIVAAILGWTERDRKWLKLVLKIGCLVGLLFTIMALFMLDLLIPYESVKNTGLKNLFIILFSVLPLAVIFIVSSILILKFYREVGPDKSRNPARIARFRVFQLVFK